MTSASLQHDHAWTITAAVVAVFAPLIRDAERADAFREVLDRVRQGLEAYEERAARMHHRLWGE